MEGCGAPQDEGEEQDDPKRGNFLQLAQIVEAEPSATQAT